MAHVQRPTSVDISNDDYSIEISCTEEFHFLDDKSTPYTRFPHEITVRFYYDTLLVSSSNPNDRVTYQSTTEAVLSVPSKELFSNRCGNVFKKVLRIVHIPFTLGEKSFKWIGKYVTSDCEGRVGIDVDRKSLENLQELISEVVRYIQKTRHNHCLPLERMSIVLNIKKLVAQPASVVALWKNWSDNMWDEYYEFVHVKPMQCLRRRWMVTVLEKRRQREGEFEPEEICGICMEELSEKGSNDLGGAVATRLHCSHVYHESCILSWFVFKTTCPYCRADAW